MEFKFKRKYSRFFFMALILHIILITLWFVIPEKTFGDKNHKNLTFFLVLTNVELLLIFYLGLFRKKYHAFHDKLLIKRSFFSDIVISYKDITRIKEKQGDTILLGFGHRPSFTIYFSTKKITIRSDNNALLLKVIKNEIDISNTINNNTKKLTK